MTARREGAEKKPAESKYPGRFRKMRATIPAAEAFRPLKDSGPAGQRMCHSWPLPSGEKRSIRQSQRGDIH
jgi:hypothetical protein